MATSAIQRHPYHLVDPSPWPFLAPLGALCATIGAVLSMHGFDGGFNLFLLGLCDRGDCRLADLRQVAHPIA